MAVILAMGYVLATAPLVDRFLNAIVARVQTPRGAIIVATLVGGIGSYLNWGFGLVIGGIIARKLALKVKGVHYPLIIASAYSGFTMYGLGLSASIPVLISTPGHPMEKLMGVIGLKETIFSTPMLLTSLAVIVTLPLLNAMLHPRDAKEVVEIREENTAEDSAAGHGHSMGIENTLATRMNNSRLLSLIIGLCGWPTRSAFLAGRFAGPEPDQLPDPVYRRAAAGHPGQLRGQAERRHQDDLRHHPAVSVLRRHHGGHGRLRAGGQHLARVRRYRHAADAAVLGSGQLVRDQLLRAVRRWPLGDPGSVHDRRGQGHQQLGGADVDVGHARQRLE
jgi:hypothetical protein